MLVRLQKLLADAGIGSRRACEKVIVSGRVSVDGRVVTELGFKADPDVSGVLVDGKPVRVEKLVYIALNKPKGYTSTCRDPHAQRSVLDLVTGIDERVFPVGRLDRDSEGLLLLTNDGAWANRISHPRYEVEKTYLVTIEGHPSSATLRRLEKGVELDTGEKTAPCKVILTRSDLAQNRSTIEVRLIEGKKRQIRRMFAAVGHPVVSILRTQIGPIKLGRLAPGTWRHLARRDIDAFAGETRS
jgi:23S rRNA pseudouridine2605 synthase